jgi:hypothetical protein
MKHIDQAKSDLCPSCLATVETAPHIFACTRRLEWRSKFRKSLRKLLDKLHTQPDLQHLLLTGIQATLTDFDFSMDPKNWEPCFALLVSSQNNIGWSHLLRGRFSIQWIQLQQHPSTMTQISAPSTALAKTG